MHACPTAFPTDAVGDTRPRHRSAGLAQTSPWPGSLPDAVLPANLCGVTGLPGCRPMVEKEGWSLASRSPNVPEIACQDGGTAVRTGAYQVEGSRASPSVPPARGPCDSRDLLTSANATWMKPTERGQERVTQLPGQDGKSRH